jgi:FtsP/CotA-like multicopper oxidase with cupredoxin domain
VLVAVDSVPSVAREQTVSYDGSAYTVRDTFRQENGDYERWVLVPVAP